MLCVTGLFPVLNGELKTVCKPVSCQKYVYLHFNIWYTVNRLGRNIIVAQYLMRGRSGSHFRGNRVRGSVFQPALMWLRPRGKG